VKDNWIAVAVPDHVLKDVPDARLVTIEWIKAMIEQHHAFMRDDTMTADLVLVSLASAFRKSLKETDMNHDDCAWALALAIEHFAVGGCLE